MADVDVFYDPISINSGPVTVAVTGLDDIKLTIEEPIVSETALTVSVPEPVKTESSLELSIPEPIKTESKAEFKSDIDLQPVVLDQCLRIALSPLPQTLICLPNRQHVGFTLFGVEIVGVTLEGEAKIHVADPPRQAQIVGGAASKMHSGDDNMRVRLGA